MKGKKLWIGLGMIVSMVCICLAFSSPAKAAGPEFEASGAVASRYGEEKFEITNRSSEERTYQCMKDGVQVAMVSVPAGETRSFIIDTSSNPGSYISVTIYDLSNPYIPVTVNSLNKYYFQKVYVFPDGSSTESQGGIVGRTTGNVTCYADEYVSRNGKTYICRTPGQIVSYGTDKITYTYEEYVQAPVDVFIEYVDMRGNQLQVVRDQILSGQNKEYVVPGSLEVKGVAYEKAADQPSVLRLSYTSPQTSYTIMYAEAQSAASKHFSVTVNYADAATGEVFYSTSFVVPAGAGKYGMFRTADKYVTGSGASYERAAGQKTQIVRYSDEGAAAETVLYNLVGKADPEQVTIHFVDANTNQVIDSDTRTVKAGETLRYDVKPGIQVNGAGYVRSSKQGALVVHSYGAGSKAYYVYYVKEGASEPSAYAVTVKFVNIADGNTLRTLQIQASAGENIFQVPETFAADGKEFILVAGQNTSMSHEYYSARRTYLVYYRDINDTANADTIIQVVTPENGGGNGGAVAIIDNGATQTPVDENGEPVEAPVEEPVNEPENQEESQSAPVTDIEDNEVPLADKPQDENGGKVSIPPAAAGGAAVLGIAALAGGCLWMKKRKNNKEDNGTEE